MSLRAGLLLLLSAAMSACGFQPLYADRSSADGTGLADIDFAAIRGPEAARDTMRDTLRRRLPDQAAEPRYTAVVDLREQAVAVSVSIDSNARRFNYTLTGRVTYIDSQTKERRSQTLQSIASYAIVPSQYASLVAREDAVRRAAIDLSRKIEADAVLYAAGQATRAFSGDLFEDEGRNDSLRTLEREADRQRENDGQEVAPTGDPRP